MNSWKRSLLLSLFLFSCSGCRIFSQEIPCRDDLDCPEDLPDCEGAKDDGGLGLCIDGGPQIEDDPANGENSLDGGPFDGGLVDGGPPGGSPPGGGPGPAPAADGGSGP